MPAISLKRQASVAVALLLGLAAWFGQQSPSDGKGAPALPRAGGVENALADAIAARRSNVQVVGEGMVAKILPDDTKGSRHQRFLVGVDSGRTILIAHNIDLAPRVENLKERTAIRFAGEYEWNDKGGVVHWTHQDPKRSHQAGWLEYAGRRYQ